MASTTTLTSSNIGALTTTFTPTFTDCNTVFYAEQPPATWLERGGALEDQQLACLPPGWAIDVLPYFSPGVCPSGFSIAYQDESKGTSTATCCPIGYKTRAGIASDDLNPCSSAVTATSSSTILSTFYGTPSKKGASTLFTFEPGTWVGARGVVIRRQDGDPSWETAESTSTPTTETSASTSSVSTADTTLPTQDSNSGQSSGLTTSAKAGIGVGVSLGVLIIIAILFAAFKIAGAKRREKHHELEEHQPQELPDGHENIVVTSKGSRTPPSEVWAPPPPSELNGHHPPSEMDAGGREVHELDASGR